MIRPEHVEHAETVFQGANKSADSPRKLRRIVRVRRHSRGLRGVSDRAGVVYVNVFIGANRLAPSVRNLYASAINGEWKVSARKSGLQGQRADGATQLQNIAEQSQKLVQIFLSEQPGVGQVGIGDGSAFGGAFLDLMTKMIADPAAVARAQIDLFNDSLKVWQKTAERMMFLRTDDAEGPKDKRFKNPEWAENALFRFVKESYLITARSILAAVRGVSGLDEATARKIDFYTRQFVDAVSPSNFVATNPEVMKATLETGGQNLLRRLENLLSDLARGDCV